MKLQLFVVVIIIGVFATVVSDRKFYQEDQTRNSIIKSIDKKPYKRKVLRAAGDKPHHQRSVKELVYDLFKGTVHESQDVYKNISRIFLNSFTTTTTTPSPDDVEADNSTTTTAQPEFHIRDFYRLVGINYKGLNRLFLKEFQLALKDSVNNVGQFRNDLKQSFSPYFRPDPKYSHHNQTLTNKTNSAT